MLQPRHRLGNEPKGGGATGREEEREASGQAPMCGGKEQAGPCVCAAQIVAGPSKCGPNNPIKTVLKRGGRLGRMSGQARQPKELTMSATATFSGQSGSGSPEDHGTGAKGGNSTTLRTEGKLEVPATRASSRGTGAKSDFSEARTSQHGGNQPTKKWA